MSTKSKMRKKAARENRSPSQELIDANSSLKQGFAKQQKRISELEKEIESMKDRNTHYKDRALNAEAELDPLKKSVSQLTAERGKWLRKLNRANLS